MSKKHPLITMRLWRHHLEPDLLANDLAMIRRQEPACDEIWLTTAFAYPPLAVHREQAEQMAQAAAVVRAAGMDASLQISNTIGHGDYLKHMDFGALTNPMVGDDGIATPYSWCPRAAEFHAYLDALTRPYCVWQPDRVWIDDDLRMRFHTPVLNGCFCSYCLTEFGKQVGREWTREALASAINEQNDLPTRAAWLRFGVGSLADIARTIAHAVKDVSPQSAMGLQHIDPWLAFSNPDWHPVFEGLRDVNGHPAGSRPGGGFYHDHQPRQMLDKALMIGRQTARLPKDIDLITYECENLPAARFGKSAHGTAVECTLAIAQGCNSLSITHLQFTHETTWHETMTATLAAWRPFWERYIAANRNTCNTGVEVALSDEHAMRPLLAGEPRFGWASPDADGIAQAATIGLPLCWNREAAAVWLHASAAAGMQEADLRRLLARGLMLDGAALAVLADRGLDRVLGLRYLQMTTPIDDMEVSGDPLNGAEAGRRIMLCGFGFGQPHGFEIVAGNARGLSSYITASGAPAGMEAAAVEHADGARLAVFGWGVGNAVVPTPRRQQVIAAADWVSRGRLPVTLETACPMVVVPRCDAQGRLKTVLLLNISLDASPDLTLTVPIETAEAAWTWLRPLSEDVEVESARSIRVPALPPWSVGVLARAR